MYMRVRVCRLTCSIDDRTWQSYIKRFLLRDSSDVGQRGVGKKRRGGKGGHNMGDDNILGRKSAGLAVSS
jgi:hypothetical protein